MSSSVPAAADFYVKAVPSLPDSQSLLVYAGHLPARPGSPGPQDDAHLYFLLEKARHLGGNSSKPGKRRLVLWLNGGPGCSSFDGLMMEIGSWRPSLKIKDQLEWTIPGGAWNEYTDVLFLDQPVGTGFSYTSTNGYAHDLTQAAKDVAYFLKRFVEVFPEYGKDADVDFFIAGESYAGQYIPYSASALLKDPTNPVNLVGIAIGNGAIDPKSQAGSELDMLIESGVWQKGSAEYNEMVKQNAICEQAKRKLGANDHPQEIDGCENLLRDIIELTKKEASSSNAEARCINIYDVRLSDTHPACGMNWPPTLAPTYSYLAREDVRSAFHVSKLKHPEAWVECNSRVSAGLYDKKSPASVSLIPSILQSGVKVLLFAGDKDLICNWIGVERVIQNLEWGGEKGWGKKPPPRLPWTVNHADAGWWQTRSNLTFVSIAGASHMVGFDKPIEAHDMMLRWMGVDSLADAAGPSAGIPSRLGDEAERTLIIGSKPGSSSGSSGQGVIVGAEGKTVEQVAEEAKWAAYYNAGSVALIFLVLSVMVGTCVLLRLRRRSRLQRRRHPSLGSGSLGPISLDNRNGGVTPGGDGDDTEHHELSHLVAHQEGLDEDEEDENRLGSASSKSARRGKELDLESGPRSRAQAQALNKHDPGQAESLFDVGDDDDDDDGEADEKAGPQRL